ncbi:MAG TPA: hypothetical protein VK463_01945 [Desulfomonilaceae bacterium]|nr:hypothetical protein [Desulfomonilaceae bacterium]
MYTHEKKGIASFHRLCSGARVILSSVLFLLSSASGLWSFAPPQDPYSPQYFSGHTYRQTLVEARLGYLWGWNEIRFRDGNNGLAPPGKTMVQLNSPLFGVMAGTASGDLAFRAQAWINIPTEWDTNFYVNRVSERWNTQAAYFEADVSAIYQLGLGNMPYTAGLMAGYRYNQLDFASTRVPNSPARFDDHFHVHVPYLGVYYAHDNLLGSVVRLDLLASPVTFALVDSKGLLNGSPMRVDANSVMGRMYELLFEVSRRVGDSSLFGLFVKGSYLELDGGATFTSPLFRQTSFSMDSRTGSVVAGLSGVYSF